jgi:predicted nucleic acid-binding protein
MVEVLDDGHAREIDALQPLATQVATRTRNRDALHKLIAAHAVALDVTLVTNNETDFAGYPGLRVENWVARG